MVKLGYHKNLLPDVQIKLDDLKSEIEQKNKQLTMKYVQSIRNLSNVQKIKIRDEIEQKRTILMNNFKEKEQQYWVEILDSDQDMKEFIDYYENMILSSNEFIKNGSI